MSSEEYQPVVGAAKNISRWEPRSELWRREEYHVMVMEVVVSYVVLSCSDSSRYVGVVTAGGFRRGGCEKCEGSLGERVPTVMAGVFRRGGCDKCEAIDAPKNATEGESRPRTNRLHFLEHRSESGQVSWDLCDES